MAVLEALERLSRGPSARSAAVRPALDRPELAGADAVAAEARRTRERLRRWHADTTPHRMLREFAGLVEAISIDHPLVLVLEDLHWSDQGTVDLVSVLAQRPERARMMLLGTYRPAQAAVLDHPDPAGPGHRCARGAGARRSRSSTSAGTTSPRTSSAASTGSRVADDVATVVHAHTDGNPLFMIVLVDHLLARGWLAEDGAVWRLTATRATIEQDVPDNLRQLIEGQLRFVSPEERDVLEVASVAGVAFDAPAVAAGLGGAPDGVESICHRLCDAQRWLRYLGEPRVAGRRARGPLRVPARALPARALRPPLAEPARDPARADRQAPGGGIRRPNGRGIERAGQALPGRPRPAARARLSRASRDARVRAARLPRRRRVPRAGPPPARRPARTRRSGPATSSGCAGSTPSCCPRPRGTRRTRCSRTSSAPRASPSSSRTPPRTSTRSARAAC